MKRALRVLLSIAIIALIVSCSMEIDNFSNDLIYIRFNKNNARSLYASNEAFNSSDYVWYYTAQKADGGSPAYGTTSGLTKVGESGSLNEEVGPFSQGYWTFTLYGFKSDIADISEGNATYQGSATVLINKENSTRSVNITVGAILSDSTGTVAFDNAYFICNGSVSSSAVPVVTISIVGITSTDHAYVFTNDSSESDNNIGIEVAQNEDGTGRFYISCSDEKACSIATDYYTATVTATLEDDSSTYSYNDTFYFRVYGNQVTTISGDISVNSNLGSILLGTYPNSAGALYKGRGIRWKVLQVDETNGGELLVSERILTKMGFDDSSNDYSSSNIRAYLNGDFVSDYALSDVNMANVDVTTNSELTIIDSGSDKVYLLSWYEATGAVSYAVSSADSSSTRPSSWPESSMAAASAISDLSGVGATWWLRTAPSSTSFATYVYTIDENDKAVVYGVSSAKGLRPAFWYYYGNEAEKTFTISYTDSLGDSLEYDGEANPETYIRNVDESQNSAIVLVNPVKDGYVFDGWVCSDVTLSESNGVYSIPADSMCNLTLKALWKESDSTVTEPVVGSTLEKGNVTWRVLAVNKEEKSALLISDSIITKKSMNSTGSSNVYATSELRSYIKDSLISDFGLSDVKSSMVSVDVLSNIEKTVTGYGNDKVFLLSYSEAANDYFQTNASRVANYEGTATYYWLRSPSGFVCNVVEKTGVIDTEDQNCEKVGVRPAFWYYYGDDTFETYNITYDLNGGALGSGVYNPEMYDRCVSSSGSSGVGSSGSSSGSGGDGSSGSGSSSGASGSLSVCALNKAVPIKNPTRTAYTFAGWKLSTEDDSCASTDYTIASDMTGDIELVAVWTPNSTQYSITYNLGSGAFDSSADVKYSYYRYEDSTLDEEVLIPNPSRTGYTFAGWTCPGVVISEVSGTSDSGASSSASSDSGASSSGTSGYYVIPANASGNLVLTASWVISSDSTADLSVGDTIKLGSVTSSDSSTSTDLTWKVLSVNTATKRALLLSEKVLMTDRISTRGTFSSYSVINAYKWSKATMNTWLNGSSSSQFMATYGLNSSKIASVGHDTEAGYNETSQTRSYEKVFLLSKTEFETYLSNDTLSSLKIAYNLSDEISIWWLRTSNTISTNTDGTSVDCVSKNGSVSYSGYENFGGIRPAFWYYYGEGSLTTYTVTYDLNGGSWDGVNANPTLYDRYDTATGLNTDIVLNTPIRTGYTFTGWTCTNTDTGVAIDLYNSDGTWSIKSSTAENLTLKANWTMESSPVVGSTYELGTYNGNSLFWRVLAVDESNNRALVVSEKILKFKQFDSSSSSDVTYSSSEIRTYLKNSFITEFGLSDVNMAKVDVFTDPEVTTVTDSGEDYVFLLSKTEVENYFGPDINTNGYNLDREAVRIDKGYTDYWWLRSLVGKGKSVYLVDSYGRITATNWNDIVHGVRPAFWYQYEEKTTSTYKITYVLGSDATISVANPTTYSIGSSAVTITLNTLTRAGYDFVGWKLSGADDSTANASGYTIPAGTNGDIELVAVWKVANDEVTYTITYDLGDGAGKATLEDGNTTSYTRNTVDENSDTVITFAKTPVWEGYTFLGWKLSGAEDSTASTESYTISSDIKSNITLVAVWKEQNKVVTYTISYDLGAGVGEGKASLEDGNTTSYTRNTVDENSDTVITFTKTPVWDGYTFLGWKLQGTNDSSASTMPYTISSEIKSDITFVAVWKGQSSDPVAGNSYFIGTDPETNQMLEWLVLEVDSTNKRALLFSKYVLCEKIYNDTLASWFDSSLRTWLNSDEEDGFIKKYGLDKSYMLIANTSNYPAGVVASEGEKTDYIFLLFSYEINTSYPIATNNKIANLINTDTATTWWTRIMSAPGKEGHMYISSEGSILSERDLTVAHGVRPAFWYQYEEGSYCVYNITYTLGDDAVLSVENPSTYKTNGTSDVTISLNAPKRSGYTFLGWKLSGTDDSTAVKDSYIVETGTFGDIELVAVWQASENEVKEYTITYDLGAGKDNGATLEDGNPASYTRNTVDENSETTVTFAMAPAWTGYIFKGWKISGDDNTVYTTSYTISVNTKENITFVAQWSTVPVAGEIVTLGTKNIPWLVLSVDTDKKLALVLSEDILETRIFDSSSREYASSEVRTYLNGDFISKYGLDDVPIQSVTVKTRKSSKEWIESEERVYLLSYNDAYKTYFNDNEQSERIAYYNGTACWWWLRSPRVEDNYGYGVGVWCVNNTGAINSQRYDTETVGLRPAFWYQYE